jgi:hypothetical protein
MIRTEMFSVVTLEDQLNFSQMMFSCRSSSSHRAARRVPAWQNRWVRETDLDYRKKFLLEPGHKVKLDDLDPGYPGKHISEDRATR